jgi:hypothetical protein
VGGMKVNAPLPMGRSLPEWEHGPPEPALRCKHGPVFKCEACGITERTDATHRTRAGRGELSWSRRPAPKRAKPGRRSRDARKRDRAATVR